jgi:hypothetical protein
MTAALMEAKQKLASNFGQSISGSIDDALTRDSLHLSEPTNGENSTSRVFAVDCKNEVGGSVADYIRASVSDNTRLAYRSDLNQFEIWGGQIPASPELVASYLAAQAGELSAATLVRRLAAIAKAHCAKGLPSPTTTELVKATMRGIPYGRTRHCPVAALEAWLALSAVTSGPLFRHVNRHGRIHPERLSGEAVSIVIRERLASAGIDPTGFSGHSLRAGFATSAAQAGVSTTKIRAQTGHASDAMLAHYIRDGELFIGNAVGALL